MWDKTEQPIQYHGEMACIADKIATFVLLESKSFMAALYQDEIMEFKCSTHY